MPMPLPFQSTPLMRGETWRALVCSTVPPHFNPLPSCEGRLASGVPAVVTRKFQSTPLMRGETILFLMCHSIHKFQSTPLMRGETMSVCLPWEWVQISIHSPHARGDFCPSIYPLHLVIFQSTPLMRGETSLFPDFSRLPVDFNPLPSCEGRRFSACNPVIQLLISIHSPHARGDVIFSRRFDDLEFQSTPLMRGETLVGLQAAFDYLISIHSPHARGDG